MNANSYYCGSWFGMAADSSYYGSQRTIIENTPHSKHSEKMEKAISFLKERNCKIVHGDIDSLMFITPNGVDKDEILKEMKEMLNKK